MPGTNGTAKAAAIDDPLDLGDLIPETRQIKLRRDGQTVVLDAYVYSTAPVSVYALIAQAHDEYMAVVDDETARGVHRDQALCLYYQRIAKALTVGMTVEEADNLGGNFPKLERMLKALGYPPPRPEPAEGEVPATGLTTGGSSPESSPSTVA